MCFWKTPVLFEQNLNCQQYKSQPNQHNNKYNCCTHNQNICLQSYLFKCNPNNFKYFYRY